MKDVAYYFAIDAHCIRCEQYNEVKYEHAAAVEQSPYDCGDDDYE